CSALFLRAHLIKDSEAFNQIYHGSNNIDPNVIIKSDI
ncbi:alpha/beta hydrolase, partial [Arthrospira sp. O9.13F]